MIFGGNRVERRGDRPIGLAGGMGVSEPVGIIAVGEVRADMATAGLLPQRGHRSQELSHVQQVRGLP